LAPVWLPSFIVIKRLGKGNKKRILSEEEEAYIRKATEDSMGFFREACKETWGYLPADSLQIYPAEGLGLRTSPTDIGMFLLAAVSYADLALPGAEEMLNMASSALKTAERLPGKAGHLYNWYDLTTMLPAPPKVLSSVDSGNLRASLYVFSEAMREYGRDEDADRARRMADGTRFDLFYRKEKKLLAVAYDDEKGMLTENSYDLYESEARIASFLAIAHGEAETEHWKKLGRAVMTFCGAAGAASWGGTMFEYLTPYLFMSAPEGTLARESEAFAVMAEKLSGERKRLPWGVSESAFYAFDDTFHYRYKAHGSSLLATAPSRSGEYVIAPYAAFMALESEGSVENLRRIEREGGRGKYGFFEAIDASDDKASRPTELYMPHHIGMQAAAAANALLDGIHRKRFMKSPNHRAFRRLLWESPRHYPEADAVLGEAPPATLGNARGARLFPEPQKRRNDQMIYDVNGKSLTLDASGVFSDPEEQLKVKLRHRDDELQLLPQKGRKGEKLETILAKDAVLFSRKEKDFTSEIRFVLGNTPHLTFILSNHAPVREEFRVTAEKGGRQFASYDVSLLPGENWREERRIDG
ncbi:MAG: hypothetical protein MJ141_09395, partial [Clostridia bacterium]|nr:hypothetical protein [Clostridia bacterium]